VDENRCRGNIFLVGLIGCGLESNCHIPAETFDVMIPPVYIFMLSFVLLWLSARIGWSLMRRHTMDEPVREEFSFILTASLTLLGLLIAFSFSMAASRYDQRKNYEEAEASAIGTEYLRADLLPDADAAKVRVLLKTYLNERILFYDARDEQEVQQIAARTTQLQTDLWSAVLPAAEARPTILAGLVVTGMNDVLNSQGYTQSAWWYRIPTAAWVLKFVIAIGCNLLIGYGSRSKRPGAKLMFILPLVTSIAFMLIADIDSPRHGIILVKPQNLASLAESLPPK
jgi:hypothetical protein